MNGKPVLVAILDEHELFREALATLLDRTPGLRVSAHAASSEELLAQFAPRVPDIVLLGTGRSLAQTLTSAAHLHAHHPSLSLLLLVAHVTPAAAVQLPSWAKISEFFLPKASGQQLVQAIQTYTGKMVNHELQVNGASGLTKQEKAVLRLVLAQFTNAEIATALVKSVRTIEGHRRNLYQKTQAHNLAGIMRYALRHGVVSLDELDELARLKPGAKL